MNRCTSRSNYTNMRKSISLKSKQQSKTTTWTKLRWIICKLLFPKRLVCAISQRLGWCRHSFSVTACVLASELSLPLMICPFKLLMWCPFFAQLTPSSPDNMTANNPLLLISMRSFPFTCLLSIGRSPKWKQNQLWAICQLAIWISFIRPTSSKFHSSLL